MDISPEFRTRPIALTASAVLAVGLLATAPSASASPAPAASVANGVLTISGTGGDDNISVALATNANSLLVDFGNGTLPQAFDLSTFRTVSVFLARGDDTFVVNAANGPVTTPLSIDGGAGNDTLFGGSGDDTIFGGSGDDAIHGADGDDLLVGDGGNDVVTGEHGNDTEFLGAGADQSVWNPGDQNDVVDGNGGYDTLVFHGANVGEKIALFPDGRHAVLTRDVAAIRMDLNNVEQLSLNTLAGNDNITVNDMSGTDLVQANIDLTTPTPGVGRLDTVTVDGTNKADSIDVKADGTVVNAAGLHTGVQLTGSQATDELQVNAGGGNDAVTVTDSARALIAVAVDLGTGQR